MLPFMFARAARNGLRRTEFNFRGDKVFHMARRSAAKIEFCTSEPCPQDRDFINDAKNAENPFGAS